MKASGHRFYLLDALRGVAALLVMLFHFFPNASHGLLGHGYLAVDFFFLLSGFIISYNYDDKLAGGLSVLRFTVTRMIRLYPLVFAGVSVSALLHVVYYHTSMPVWDFAFQYAANAFALPSSLSSHDEKFLFDPPSWSIFFELFVNIFYAAAFRFLKGRFLLLIVILTGTALEGTVEYLHRVLIFGILRTFFSFFLGVLIFRVTSRDTASSRSGVSLSLSLFFVCLVLPKDGIAEYVYDFVAILVVFPAVIWFASGSSPVSWLPVQKELGELSYPIYILHMPVSAVTGVLLGWLMGGSLLSFAAVAVTIAASALAWRLYDRPVRAWLSRRLLTRMSV